MVTLEDVLAVAENLSPVDKIRLIERLASSVEQEMPQEKKPLDTLYGLWAEYNIDISEDDIAEVRREMWGEFSA